MFRFGRPPLFRGGKLRSLGRYIPVGKVFQLPFRPLSARSAVIFRFLPGLDLRVGSVVSSSVASLRFLPLPLGSGPSFVFRAK